MRSTDGYSRIAPSALIYQKFTRASRPRSSNPQSKVRNPKLNFHGAQKPLYFFWHEAPEMVILIVLSRTAFRNKGAGNFMGIW